MEVAQYTFQSPSTSQVQVGKLDPNSVKEEEPSKEEESSKEKPNVEAIEVIESVMRALDIYV